MNIQLGLIGKGIGHSFSPQLYKTMLKVPFSYDLIDVDSTDSLPSLASLFGPYHGINITAPYKNFYLKEVQLVDLPHCVTNINCLFRSQDYKSNLPSSNKILATSTDYFALRDLLKDYIKQYKIQKIFILGNGATSQLTQIVLRELPFLEVVVLSRSSHPEMAMYDFTKEHKLDSMLVINACSREFVFKGKLDKRYIFWDYNYNLFGHSFNREQIHLYFDGMNLLKLQAEYCLKYWNL